jgi:hypothetical protein
MCLISQNISFATVKDQLEVKIVHLGVEQLADSHARP